jgi:SAM-dependent methyltransferase
MTESSAPLAKEIVGREHWDHFHSGRPRMRLPSTLLVGTKNLYRLMDSRVSSGMRVLEVGFAPGKALVGVASRYKAVVAGVDYSAPGVATGHDLFRALGMKADLRCESIFETSFAAESFDLVYSIGVIEHFTDPRPIVAAHYRLIKRGGRCLILIPRYRGLYGALQSYFDPENLAIHNLDIMEPAALERLACGLGAAEVRVFRSGSMDASFVNWHRKLPRPLARSLQLFANGLGRLQPFDIGPLCPLLALELVK